MKLTVKILITILIFSSIFCLVFYFFQQKKGTSFEKLTQETTNNKIPTETSTRMVVNAKGGLRIRERPNITSKKIGLIPDGAEIETFGEILERQTIDGKTGRWMKISYDNISGYSFSGFLEKIDLEARENSKVTEYFKENIGKLLPTLSNIDYNVDLDERSERKHWDNFTIINTKTSGNFTVITISPYDQLCEKYSESVCYNFIFRNDRLLFSDMNMKSLGELSSLTETSAKFISDFGCGGNCDYYIESWEYEYIFEQEQLFYSNKYISESSCSESKDEFNECRCSNTLKNSIYRREKTWQVDRNGKLTEISSFEY